VNLLLKRFDLRIINRRNWDFIHDSPYFRAGSRWVGVPDDLSLYIRINLQYSFAQLQQDLFAAWCIEQAEKKNLIPNQPRYFVEFGATNGFTLSNTFFLEKLLGWSGLLCEPARIWQRELRKIRICNIDLRCVTSKSGELLDFNETLNPEFSTLSKYENSDGHIDQRKSGDIYKVESVSINDLLASHHSPLTIDYLSIDTEGSELEILQALDFDKYLFRVLTIEHNFTPKRESVQQLLTKNGYKHVLAHVSQQDDWFIHESISQIFE
jgi:FkbM family methyltransferase